MLSGVLAWIGLPGEPLTGFSELRPGAAQVDGVLRTEHPLESPIHHRPCAAFHYRARFSATRVIRGSQTNLRTLRTATVYAPELVLEMFGGDLDLAPAQGETFTSQDHEALAAADFPGFAASETRMGLGTRVRALGRLRRHEDRWVLTFTGLVPLDGK